MSMFKKVLALVLVVALTAGIAITGTIAYLQDEDSNVNVMTLGNVKIQQHEQQKAEDGSLEPFRQAKGLYPGTEVSKIVTVENTGKSDAYIRTLIAFEDIDSETFGVNFPINEAYRWSWGAPAATFELDGVTYQVYEALYPVALKPGETSPASLTKVELAATATNEDMEALGDTYDILVATQAVQIEGFADAETALNAAFGKITDDNHPWVNTVIVSGDDEAKLLGALTSGKDVIVKTDIVQIDDAAFDGNGRSVTLAGTGSGSYGYLSFDPGKGNNTKVENLEVTGSGFVEVGHWEMGGGTYEVNNLVLKDMASTLANGDKGFTLGCTFCHYGNATLNNCVMTGATAINKNAIPVDAGFVNGTTTTVNGGRYGTIYCWSQAKVTINGADIDTIYAAPINGTVTIKAGTHVDTINIAYGTSAATAARLAKLVIEEGATVGTFVYNANNYSTLDEVIAALA